MADVLDKVQKLIALALNNPNDEEASSAAMKAVSLIVAANLSIGGQAANTPFDPRRRKAWKPDSEFDEFWNDITKQSDEQFHRGWSQDDMDRDQWAQPSPAPDGGGLKTAYVDTDVEDAFSAMRTRIKVAWRAIQKERARLKTEIHNWEVRYGHRYPRQEPKDWENE